MHTLQQVQTAHAALRLKHAQCFCKGNPLTPPEWPAAGVVGKNKHHLSVHQSLRALCSVQLSPAAGPEMLDSQSLPSLWLEAGVALCQIGEAQLLALQPGH